MIGEFWEHSQNAYSEASRFLTEQVKRCLEDGRLDDALRICETMPLYVSKKLSEEIFRSLEKDAILLESHLKRALNCLQNGMPYSAQKILMEEDRRLSSSPLARSILSIIHETDLLHRKLFSDKCHKKELRNTLLNYKSILYRPLPAASDYWKAEGHISSLKRTLEETSALHFRKRSSLEKDISDQTMLLARIYERYDQERRQRNAQMIPSILQIQQKMAFIKEDERRIRNRLEELETYMRSLTVE